MPYALTVNAAGMTATYLNPVAPKAAPEAATGFCVESPTGRIVSVGLEEMTEMAVPDDVLLDEVDSTDPVAVQYAVGVGQVSMT